jgi:hypothetical protein
MATAAGPSAASDAVSTSTSDHSPFFDDDRVYLVPYRYAFSVFYLFSAPPTLSYFVLHRSNPSLEVK